MNRVHIFTKKKTKLYETYTVALFRECNDELMQADFKLISLNLTYSQTNHRIIVFLVQRNFLTQLFIRSFWHVLTISSFNSLTCEYYCNIIIITELCYTEGNISVAFFVKPVNCFVSFFLLYCCVLCETKLNVAKEAYVIFTMMFWPWINIIS